MDSTKILWPKTVRLIHWAIAILVTLNLFILEEGDPPHRYIGYAAVFLVAIRFFYGFTTKTEASFQRLPLSFRELKRFLAAKARFEKIDYPGHNPAASWVYILIWLCILCLAITGFMMGLDRFWGDETLEEIHELFSNAVLALVVIHFIGIALDSIQYKRKTWLGMITGKK
ncbi:MAG: cytochrome b/b6 domain-containing protein [Bacillota bacterium]